ncbi:MAG: T9SS type A sorting domain-containing protein [Candidatus Aegiribacteria sp.]|nr:T9SS type A sorting domain-containing protein [Candidatus Aegiribacteria sp.]
MMKMKICIQLIVLNVLFISSLQAQISVNYHINTTQGIEQISPYVYGVNMMTATDFSTARRMGGNRLTGFNWENNASNAGADYYHSSDNYIPWILGVPSSNYAVPGISLTTFHNTSLSQDDYTLLTLPMAGYAARDKNGTVPVSETAPSSRWVEVINRKGSAFVLLPDTTDNVLYIDELLYFIINAYGTANTSTGVKGYILDNEPALWVYTHPRLHSDTLTVAELMSKSIDLAATVKEMDSYAEVFGPDLYGFSAILNLQNAPDWSNYSGTYNRFIEAYLDLMRQASDSAGYRLLDVLDIHWYPAPTGIHSGDTSQTVSEARMQVPRTLWDSTYVEDSWIGQYFSPVVLLHYLHNAIDQYYPGTKLSITEYNYGASNHISGGIAQVEALGVFGKYGVYFASKWGTTEAYITTAFNMYRNYDGNSNTFGSTKVMATMNDTLNTSIYVTVDDSDPTCLHIIVLNKNYNSTINGNFQITSNYQYNAADVWYFDRYNTSIHNGTGFSIANNRFDFNLSPLSVYHIVLTNETYVVEEEEEMDSGVNDFTVYYNSLMKEVNVNFHEVINSDISISIYDISGKKLKELNIIPSGTTVNVDVEYFMSGMYFLQVQTVDGIISKKFLLF